MGDYYALLLGIILVCGLVAIVNGLAELRRMVSHTRESLPGLERKVDDLGHALARLESDLDLVLGLRVRRQFERASRITPEIIRSWGAGDVIYLSTMSASSTYVHDRVEEGPDGTVTARGRLALPDGYIDYDIKAYPPDDDFDANDAKDDVRLL